MKQHFRMHRKNIECLLLIFASDCSFSEWNNISPEDLGLKIYPHSGTDGVSDEVYEVTIVDDAAVGIDVDSLT